MPEVSLCAGHQKVSECFREPASHITALRDRGPVNGAPRRAYAPRLKPRGAIRRVEPNDHRHRCATLGKSGPVGTSGEIVAGMIRPYSKTPELRSVLRCRRHTRCRGPRADAIPWQKPLLQRSECGETGCLLGDDGSLPVRIFRAVGYPSGSDREGAQAPNLSPPTHRRSATSRTTSF